MKTMEIKAKHCDISVDEAYQSSLTIVFYSQNGVQFFIDMDPKYHKLKKNNVYRNISIEIIEGDYKAPLKLWNYGSVWTHNEYLLAKFHGVPEKIINELVLMNGGIDIDRFILDFTSMWESFKSETA
jgi:hypothetical protein